MNRGYEILINFACVYGAGQIVRLVVDKNLTIGQVIQLLKEFYIEHRELGLNLTKLINRTIIHAGAYLKDVIGEGIIVLKIIATNAF